MSKIGILGGTFNPIHNAHLMIAKAALMQFELDEIWLMPAGMPPHKNVENCPSRSDRLAMCKLVSDENPGIKTVDIEINSLDRNYSYKTCTYLKEHYPDDDFYFIIGEDSLNMFKNWVHPEIISRSVTILVAVRSIESASNLEVINAELERNKDLFEGDFYLLMTDYSSISSTDIRNKRYIGESIDGLVPEQINKYILKHNLYSHECSLKDIRKIEDKLKEILKASRYEHTLGVMHTASNLAMRYSYSMNDAMMAGLLHDCAKYMSDADLLKECKKHKLAVTEAEELSPHLLHAKVGAYYAKKIYHVEDEKILHAILVHTTGCPDMSLLDQIIFVADYIEPGRDKAPNLTELRRIAYEDLDLCCAIILRDTVRYLEEKANPIDSTTYDTYSYYLNKIKARGNDISLIIEEV